MAAQDPWVSVVFVACPSLSDGFAVFVCRFAGVHGIFAHMTHCQELDSPLLCVRVLPFPAVFALLFDGCPSLSDGFASLGRRVFVGFPSISNGFHFVLDRFPCLCSCWGGLLCAKNLIVLGGSLGI